MNDFYKVGEAFCLLEEIAQQRGHIVSLNFDYDPISLQYCYELSVSGDWVHFCSIDELIKRLERELND